MTDLYLIVRGLFKRLIGPTCEVMSMLVQAVSVIILMLGSLLLLMRLSGTLMMIMAAPIAFIGVVGIIVAGHYGNKRQCAYYRSFKYVVEKLREIREDEKTSELEKLL